MAVERKKVPKSESLTIRLDPKTRFILDFVARLRGQTITTVVERAINEGASQISLDFGDSRTWRDFWDVSEGIRALQIAREPLLHPTYEEERRLAFTVTHWPFFYTSDTRRTFRRTYIEILWPQIDELVEMHERQKATDWFSTGHAMQVLITAAGVMPPEWPIGSGQTSAPATGGSFFADLDDEIPF